MEKTLINKRIAIIRKHFNLSQTDFGGQIGVTQANISQIEKGEVDCKATLLVEICNKFNVNPQWLIQGVGDIFLNESDVEIKKPLLKIKPSESEESMIEFLKEELRQKNRIIDTLLNSDKTSQSAGFSA